MYRNSRYKRFAALVVAIFMLMMSVPSVFADEMPTATPEAQQTPAPEAAKEETPVPEETAEATEETASPEPTQAAETGSATEQPEATAEASEATKVPEATEAPEATAEVTEAPEEKEACETNIPDPEDEDFFDDLELYLSAIKEEGIHKKVELEETREDVVVKSTANDTHTITYTLTELKVVCKDVDCESPILHTFTLSKAMECTEAHKYENNVCKVCAYERGSCAHECLAALEESERLVEFYSECTDSDKHVHAAHVLTVFADDTEYDLKKCIGCGCYCYVDNDSVTHYDVEPDQGDVVYEEEAHTWENGVCTKCGATRSVKITAPEAGKEVSGKTALIVRWNAPAYAAQYKVEYNGLVIMTTAASYTISASDVPFETSLTIKVTAYDANNNAMCSAIVTVKTGACEHDPVNRTGWELTGYKDDRYEITEETHQHLRTNLYTIDCAICGKHIENYEVPAVGEAKPHGATSWVRDSIETTFVDDGNGETHALTAVLKYHGECATCGYLIEKESTMTKSVAHILVDNKCQQCGYQVPEKHADRSQTNTEETKTGTTHINLGGGGGGLSTGGFTDDEGTALLGTESESSTIIPDLASWLNFTGDDPVWNVPAIQIVYLGKAVTPEQIKDYEENGQGAQYELALLGIMLDRVRKAESNEIGNGCVSGEAYWPEGKCRVSNLHDGFVKMYENYATDAQYSPVDVTFWMMTLNEDGTENWHAHEVAVIERETRSDEEGNPIEDLYSVIDPENPRKIFELQFSADENGTIRFGEHSEDYVGATVTLCVQYHLPDAI